jgi:hypothetical protein
MPPTHRIEHVIPAVAIGRERGEGRSGCRDRGWSRGPRWGHAFRGSFPESSVQYVPPTHRRTRVGLTDRAREAESPPFTFVASAIHCPGRDLVFRLGARAETETWAEREQRAQYPISRNSETLRESREKGNGTRGVHGSPLELHDKRDDNVGCGGRPRRCGGKRDV